MRVNFQRTVPRIALLLAGVLGVILLAIALPVGVQSQESDDHLELYDATPTA